MTLRQRLDLVTNPDSTAREHVGTQPASVYEATQYFSPRYSFEVRTRLASAGQGVKRKIS